MIKKCAPSFSDTFIRMYPEYIVDKTINVKNVTFVVTQECSLRCTYCYEHSKNSDSVMTLEVAKQTIDMLFTEEARPNSTYISENNARAIVLEFIGGEPLLEIDLIDSIMDYFIYKALTLNHRWALHYMISISTNGIAYFQPNVQRFIRKHRERLSIGMTIDGNKELHDSCRKFPDGTGSYDIVEKAFLAELKRFPDASTKLTIAPANIKYLFEAIHHLFNLGVKDIYSNCIFEKGWKVEHSIIFYNQLKDLSNYLLTDKNYEDFACSLFDSNIGTSLNGDDNANWCGGSGKMLAIDSKGMIYPCLRFMPFSLKDDIEPIIIGDIYNGIASDEKQRETISCLSCITRYSQSTKECYNCPIAKGCAWCTAYNYEETGSTNKRVTYICIMHKARVLANAYYWNKVYRSEGVADRIPMNISKEWALEIISEDEYNMLCELAKED